MLKLFRRTLLNSYNKVLAGDTKCTGKAFEREMLL